MAKARRTALLALLLLALICISRLHLTSAEHRKESEDKEDSDNEDGEHEDGEHGDGEHEDDFERCGNEHVDDDHYKKDPTFGGRCNGKKEDDDSYWSKTPKVSKKYNDDAYGGCSKKVCRAPVYQGCCDKCSSTKGVQGIFVIPPSVTTKSSSAPYLVSSSVSVAECCALATENKAYFWQHYVASGGSASSGKCFLYLSGAPAPVCVTAAANSRLDGNASTVGKTCPYGKHDPHFMGAHGTLFEFNGMPDKAFCLLTDRHFHVNMKMRGYLDTRTEGASITKDGRAVRTWIRELGIVWDDETNGEKHSLRLAARDGKSMARDAGFLKVIEYDGQEVPLLGLGDVLFKPGGLVMKLSAYEKQGGGFFDADVYNLKIADKLALRITLRAAHPLLQTSDDAEVHLNVQFMKIDHSEEVHGIMGQTYRNEEGREKRAMDYSALATLLRRSVAADSETGKGFLDGAVKDYEVTSVLSTDCAYTAFGKQAL